MGSGASYIFSMLNTPVTANTPKIGLELEGIVSPGRKWFEYNRKDISKGLVAHLKEKMPSDQLSFELQNNYNDDTRRLEVKSLPHESVLKAVLDLSERVEEVQHYTTQYYRACVAAVGRESCLNERILFVGLPPHANQLAETTECGLHIHAEVPESQRKQVAQQLVPYTTVMAGLTMSSPFGGDYPEHYSMRMRNRLNYSSHLEDISIFRTAPQKVGADDRYRPRPETLEFMLCDATSDPKAIASAAAIYQAAVMKAQAEGLEHQEVWGNQNQILYDFAKTGYEESLPWKGQQVMFDEMVEDVLDELSPYLERTGTVEIAGYARHIAKGNTCAHQQKAAFELMADRIPDKETFGLDIMNEMACEVSFEKAKGYALGSAYAFVEKDLAYRSLRLHREARAMSKEYSSEQGARLER